MTQATTVHRLSESAYREIEKACKPLDVGHQTTDLMTAYTLGQQSVLKRLRDGFTIGA